MHVREIRLRWRRIDVTSLPSHRMREVGLAVTTLAVGGDLKVWSKRRWRGVVPILGELDGRGGSMTKGSGLEEK